MTWKGAEKKNDDHICNAHSFKRQPQSIQRLQGLAQQKDGALALELHSEEFLKSPQNCFLRKRYQHTAPTYRGQWMGGAIGQHRQGASHRDLQAEHLVTRGISPLLPVRQVSNSLTRIGISREDTMS